MRVPHIGSRVKFIRFGVLFEGMVYDRRPCELPPLSVVSLGHPAVFLLRDDEVVVVSGQFCAPATRPAE